ncbi:hypothetical protein OH77DRAFT_461229 [Trametes cingulata]|nr:hypothetical protein OH77DRAFT_461229 [Trametes cingulata]
MNQIEYCQICRVVSDDFLLSLRFRGVMRTQSRQFREHYCQIEERLRIHTKNILRSLTPNSWNTTRPPRNYSHRTRKHKFSSLQDAAESIGGTAGPWEVFWAARALGVFAREVRVSVVIVSYERLAGEKCARRSRPPPPSLKLAVPIVQIWALRPRATDVTWLSTTFTSISLQKYGQRNSLSKVTYRLQ